MGLDDNLLSENNSSSENSSSSDEESVSESSPEKGPFSDSASSQGATPAGVATVNQPKSLREAVRMEKARKTDADKKAETAEQKSNPIRMQTSALLRSAWVNLIPSWGLTLLWIDIHVFLRQILGKSMFCKLGEEWTDRPGMKNSMPKLEGDGKETKMLTMTEPMGAACCNFGCLLILLIIITIIAMIAGVADFLVDLVAKWFAGMFSWWPSPKT